MRWIALPALLSSVLIVACGGGSMKTTTPSTTKGEPPRSRDDFIEVADAVCRNHQSRREDLESQAGELGALTSREKARRVAVLLRKESANRRAEVAELRSLQPPPTDRPAVDEILSLIGAETRVIDRWADAYDAGNPAAIRRLQIRLGVTGERATVRARAFGFEVCGQH